MKKLSTLFILLISILSWNLNAQENAFTSDFEGSLNIIDLSDATLTSVGITPPTFSGMDFGPDNILYGLDKNNDELYQIDTSDASTTYIGTATLPSTHGWTGMAYDGVTDIMYACAVNGTAGSATNLYTIDLSDGSITLVGSQTTANAIGCIGIDDDGQMYGLQLDASAKIYKIDKTDGSVSLVGNVNEFGGFGQGYGMDFNSDNQTMYLTAYDSFSTSNYLYTVNLTTGATTSVGSLDVWNYALAIVTAFYCDFSADETTVCSSSTVNFSNESSGADSWAWTFEGGTPSTSTDQHPSVVYATPGDYDVQLTITNSQGDTETEFKAAYVNVIETPAKVNVPVGDDGVCTDRFYDYSADEVLYAENYEWELSPSNAGTITYDLNIANLETADDWTGDFTLRVRATNMCGDGEWSDYFEGTLSQSPEEFALEGGGSYCLGDDGVELTLDGSQTGVSYELYLDSEATGIIVPGTGSALTFGLVTEEGYYEAIAFNTNCEFTMQNQAAVSIAYPPLDPETPVGPETICTETTSDYTSEGSDDADSYEWEISPEDAGTITANGLEASVNWNSTFTGTASVSLYGINDCGEGSSSELVVAVGTANPIISGETMVCDFSDEIYEVANNEGSTYAWIVTGGAITEGQGTYMITVSWTGEGNGTISVDEETAGGCSGSSEQFDVVIDDCTGIGEDDQSTTLSIYPNPAKDILNISFNPGSTTGTLTVYDINGHLVLEKEIQDNNGEQKINVSTFTDGMYLVKIQTGGKVLSSKLFIKN